MDIIRILIGSFLKNWFK